MVLDPRRRFLDIAPPQPHSKQQGNKRNEQLGDAPRRPPRGSRQRSPGGNLPYFIQWKVHRFGIADIADEKYHADDSDTTDEPENLFARLSYFRDDVHVNNRRGGSKNRAEDKHDALGKRKMREGTRCPDYRKWYREQRARRLLRRERHRGF